MNKLLSVSVMGHVQREEFFPYLREKLGDVPFAIDDGSKGLWRNCADAWMLHDPAAEYHLVVQDDAIPCENFYERVAPILKHDCVYQLYAGERMAKKIDAAKRAGKEHVLDNRMYNEVALCMKTTHVADMVAYCDRRGATNDRLIQTFARERGLKFYTPIPSLFDHRAGPSIYRAVRDIPELSQERHAYQFIDRV